MKHSSSCLIYLIQEQFNGNKGASWMILQRLREENSDHQIFNLVGSLQRARNKNSKMTCFKM